MVVVVVDFSRFPSCFMSRVSWKPTGLPGSALCRREPERQALALAPGFGPVPGVRGETAWMDSYLSRYESQFHRGRGEILPGNPAIGSEAELEELR